MDVEFGYVLFPGVRRQGQQSSEWLTDLDELLPQLEGLFSSFWATDHFQWDEKDCFEAWTKMCFLAARFPQYQFGTTVLGQSYRNPALLAKMAATIQTLSGGRFILGVGAGWKEDEYHAYGYDFPSAGTRVAQLEDTLEILTRMWRQEGQVSYEGTHYSVNNAWCEPKPEPIPTLMVGGGGRKTTRLAARFADWWNVPDCNLDIFRDRLQRLYNGCDAEGRDYSTIRKSWFGRLGVARTYEAAVALSDGEWTEERGFIGTPDQVVQSMMDFIDAGCSYFMVELLGMDNDDTKDMVLNDVLPRVQKLASLR